MGLPSRTMWARTNIDISQPSGFAVSEFQLGASYFSWGNVEGHNANEGSFSPYDWGTSASLEPYRTSPGAAIAYPGSLDLAHDCANVVLGAPWRVPGSSDFIELEQNCDYIDANGDVISGDDKIITIDDVVGIRMRSKINGNILFFAACGYGESTSLQRSNERGEYWLSSLESARDATMLLFYTSEISASFPFGRHHGCTIRPIFRI